ncbi:hypothetical protein BVX99_00620 [bacterium F16]|nr:hypothetical protein BVX99_00620 [bacterium F16]
MYKELESQGRLLLTDYPTDWEAYNVFEPVCPPDMMTPEELYNGVIDAYRTVSSFRTFLERGLRTVLTTRRAFSTGLSFFWNYDSFKTITNVTSARMVDHSGT